MYRGNKTKKISFRVTEIYYNSIYNAYLRYKDNTNTNINFSDFIRNYCLASLVKQDDNKSNN